MRHEKLDYIMDCLRTNIDKWIKNGINFDKSINKLNIKKINKKPINKWNLKKINEYKIKQINDWKIMNEWIH